MSIPITKDDVVAVWSLSEVNRWANKPTDSSAVDNSDNNIAAAISKGWSEIRSAALNKYEAVSFDAMSTATLPDIVKGYGVDLIADWLASGNAESSEVATRAARARQWLGRLATGYDHSLEGVVALQSSATGGASARVGGDSCGLIFDRANPLSAFRNHKGSLP